MKHIKNLFKSALSLLQGTACIILTVLCGAALAIPTIICLICGAEVETL